MSDDRLARALLRLYPRTWRARYGDELLALIADTGLTWCGAIDVAGAASLERARVLVALWRGQAEPDATLPAIGGASFREMLVEGLATLTLVAGTVLALAALGVPLPGTGATQWGRLTIAWWSLYLVAMDDSRIPRPASLVDRVMLRFGTFAGGIGVAALAWLAGRALVRAGLPQPSVAVLGAGVLSLFALAAVRFASRAIRSAYRAFRSPGWIDGSRISTLEVRAWGAAGVGVLVILGMPVGFTEAFWERVMCCVLWLGWLRMRHYTSNSPRPSGEAV